MKSKLHNLSAPLALAMALLGVSRLGAQTTAFTYQGALNLNGGSANGLYDLQFNIFDAPSGGALAGGPLTNAATGVSNGLFTVTLDFGAGVFTGPNRWLEIAVATNGGAFTTLTPRQQVTSTPYAIQALNASEVNSSNIVGSLSTSQLPPAAVTNGATGLNLSGAFSGNGAGLTNVSVNAANVTTGTLADALLSTNVALRAGGNVFSGSQQVVDLYFSSEILDQQQTGQNGTGGLGYSVWQSFLAGASGVLSKVALGIGASSPVTISIYAGQGTGGALLATQTVAFSSTPSLQTFNLTSLPTVQAGNEYTILCSVSGQAPQPSLQFNSHNPYTNGVCSFDPSFDLLFQTYVAQTNTGPILVVNPGFSGRVGIGTNLPQAKLHVSGSVLASAFTGDGSALTNLNSANIAGTLAYSQLPSTLLSNNASGVALSGTFKGSAIGTFNGDGGGLTNVNASNVTSGTLADAQLSTNVALRTGGNLFSDSQQVFAAYLNGSEALDQQQTNYTEGGAELDQWQSFTAGQSGFLTRVALFVSSPIAGSPSPGTIRIYSGEGTSGTLLATQSVTFSINYSFQSFALSSPAQVQAGSQYTIRFGAPQFNVAWVPNNSGNPYPGGRSDLGTNIDYLFETYVAPSTTGTILAVNPPNRSGNVGIGTALPQAKLHVAGDVLVAGLLTGNGGGLTNLSTANLIGVLTGNGGGLTNLSTTNLVGVFSGNGSGLTALNATNIASGTVADARLSANVALLNANQTFSGSNTFSGVAALTNANNTLVGAHSGNGAAITGLNAGNIATGTLTDARLSANVALLNANQTFSGSNNFSGAAMLTNANNTLAGNGNALTSLNAANLTGSVPSGSLTSVPAGSLTGTVADGRLSANVALLSANNQFTGTNGLNDHDLRLRTGTDGNHGLGYYGASGSKSFGGFAPDGPVLFGFAGGGLGTINGGAQAVLTWTSAGNIGIGTTNSDRPLAIVANSTVFGEWLSLKDHSGTTRWILHDQFGGINFAQSGVADDRLFLSTNGFVGIGTGAPTNNLHVIGGATFSSGTSGGNQNVVWVPGNGSWSFTSDRNTKDRVAPVDSQAVLEKLAHVPIHEWSYIGYGQRHIGPMAQDFHAQFPLNENDKALNDADLHGVALAAIQGLNQKLDQKETEISELKRQISELREAVNTLKR